MPRDEQKHCPHHNDRGADLKQIVRSLVKKSFELVDVVVKNGKDVAFLSLIKPCHSLFLDMVERVQSQLMLNGLGQVSPEDSIEIFEQRFKPPYEEGKDGEQDQLMPWVNHAQRGEG